MNQNTQGLAGITAGETKICTVGREGKGLHYRGYSIEDLAPRGCFEEVAYLLLMGNLPSSKELDEFKQKLVAGRHLPEGVKRVLKELPSSTHPMDVLRTACSVLGALEPEDESRTGIAISIRLLGFFPAALLYWYHFSHGKKEVNLSSKEPLLARFFLQELLEKEPSDTAVSMMDCSLILYAEHEFNASTFAARVATSTLSDIYSAITSAIGTLRGPLHGGANEAAMELISRFSTPEEAEAGIMQMLSKKEKIMGFGHRVYKIRDPRSDIIQGWANKMAVEVGDTKLYPISERIHQVMKREKNLFPNLDFYSASAYSLAGIPTELFTPIFVFSRTAGWAAHVLEQRENNRLIRPLAEYKGPEPREYIAIEGR